MSSPRARAVRLLEAFFAHSGERERRAVFDQAFDGTSPDPRIHIEFNGPPATFAAEAVQTLLQFGCARRGQHHLSLLLNAMESIRGRQTNPDYHDLPRLLNAECALPTRAEEQQHLARLLADAETKARLYSPLHGIAKTPPPGKPNPSVLLPWTDDPDIALLRHRSRQPEELAEIQRDYDNILTAFAHVKHAALLGAPGSGKSTTLRKLAVDLARTAQQDPQAPLPLLADLGKWTRDEPLAAFLSTLAPEIGWAVHGLSHAGRLVLLLDGLNEVPTAGRAAKARDVLKTSEQILHPATPVIVSCRREDYTGDLDLGLSTLTLEPLTPPRIRAAVRQWVGEEPGVSAERFFWDLAGDQRLAGVLDKWLAAGGEEGVFWSSPGPDFGKIDYHGWDIWPKHIPNLRSLLNLASNPFMLGMLFQVWVAEEGALPQNRGELFGRFINRLLSREGLLVRHAASGEWRLEPEGQRLLDGLADLAWSMQRQRSGREDLGVLTVVPRTNAVAALGGEKWLKHALDGTLLEGGEELRFRHQLLQEYFTAKALEARLSATGAAELWPPDRWWKRSGWEETAVLLAGFHGDDCGAIIRWLKDAQPEVAAQCIVESGAKIEGEEKLRRELQSAWLPRLASDPQPEGRAAVGRALGRLKLDNRKGVGLRAGGVPDIDWVKVDQFFMARYPVTNAQFEAFVKDDGYGDDRWWKGLTNPDRQAKAPSWSEDNHPRETVSWYEAMAFCKWLESRTGDKQVRLPTEEEWERAARGTEGRAYPWGEEYIDGYANIGEDPHRLGRTSAVGIYPDGRSRENGILDLSGNVWEWCLNEYEKPDRVQPGGETSRVLRGGSWFSIRDYARAGYRDLSHPGVRYSYFGFRVVCSSPSANSGR